MSKAVYINRMASFLPNKPVSNDNMESVLGFAGGKPSRSRRIVLRNNGIKQRYYAIDPVSGKSNYTNAQLAAEAVKKLMVDNDQPIGCLVAASSVPDQILPGHGVMVQGELKNPATEVVTTSGVCLCGVTALKYAYMSIASNTQSTAVAVASEMPSAVMRGYQFDAEIEEKIRALESHAEIAFEKDFLRWMLSDGAGSAFLSDTPNKDALSLRIEWIDIRSYANEQEVCMYAAGDKIEGQMKGWAQYTPQEWGAESIFSIKQDVRLLNEHVIHYTVERALSEIVKKRSISPSEIDFFLPHYSSEFFREKVYAGLKNIHFEIPFAKWFTNLTEKGNTGAASIFIMLDELWSSGKLEKDQQLLCYIPESGRFSSAFMLLKVV